MHWAEDLNRKAHTFCKFFNYRMFEERPRTAYILMDSHVYHSARLNSTTFSEPSPPRATSPKKGWRTLPMFVDSTVGMDSISSLSLCDNFNKVRSGTSPERVTTKIGNSLRLISCIEGSSVSGGRFVFASSRIHKTLNKAFFYILGFLQDQFWTVTGYIDAEQIGLCDTARSISC